MGECNPDNFVTQHECLLCKEVDKQLKLPERVTNLESIIPRFQWWFIGILIAIIMSGLLLPRLTQNGTHDALKEVTNKLNIVVDKQDSFDTILNDVRAEQIKRSARER